MGIMNRINQHALWLYYIGKEPVGNGNEVFGADRNRRPKKQRNIEDMRATIIIVIKWDRPKPILKDAEETK